MSQESPQLVAALHCKIGENPLWHAEDRRIYFLNIPAGEVHAYDPASRQSSIVCRTRVTGGFTIQQDGSLLLFQDGHIAILSRDGSVREVAREQCLGNDRFNDVIADPEGRVFAGTIGGDGKLFRYDLDGSVTEILHGLGIPNGMGFTPDLTGMYFTDSVPRHIYYFDYDRKTGELSNRRVFAEIPLAEGVPDGMAIDEEGFIWTAVWYGGRLKRYAPEGRLDCEIKIPATQSSALAFGGSTLTDIYVTSAWNDESDALAPPSYDPRLHRGGGLYHVAQGIRGKLPFRSRLFL